MTWLDAFSDIKTARERAETAFYAPIGMMSPLWIAFGAAASAGAAFWLMSRFAKPVNIEATMTSSKWAAPALDADVATRSPIGDVMIEASEIESACQPVGGVVDDLTKLAGVGPKIAKALAERGVESFAQLAAWTEQDIAAFDAALDLRGRAIRAGFVAQAGRLAADEG